MPEGIGCPNTISKGVKPYFLFGVFWIFIRAKGKASGSCVQFLDRSFLKSFLCPELYIPLALMIADGRGHEVLRNTPAFLQVGGLSLF